MKKIVYIVCLIFTFSIISSCNNTGKSVTQPDMTALPSQNTNSSEKTKQSMSINNPVKSEESIIKDIPSTIKEQSKSNLFLDNNNYKINDPKTYTDKKFNFSVNYPAEWKTEVEKTWDATSTHEASPDGGINIFIEGNKIEKIYIFGQVGPIGMDQSDFTQEKFFTNGGIDGQISYKDIEGRKLIYLILNGDGYHGAIINVSNECFTRNSQQILGILKSIKLGVVGTAQKNLINENNKAEEKEDIYIPEDAKKYLEKKEMNNPGLMINDKLQPIYDKYKDTLDDSLLKGLQPIDILRLHNKAVEEENLVVETNLIILPPEIKREDFLIEVQSDEVSNQNDRLLLEKYKQFNGKVIEITVNQNKAYVVIQGDGFWRFEKTENGVWKFGWLSRQ